MFKIFNTVRTLEAQNKILINKVGALEDHLNVDYFNGPKYAPHYRKKRVVAKKLGRPRKTKQNHA